tara:strand:- start:1370 stop:2932 length:1563 start_codon:yes stop_codon:yes gene_type:complete
MNLVANRIFAPIFQCKSMSLRECLGDSGIRKGFRALGFNLDSYGNCWHEKDVLNVSNEFSFANGFRLEQCHLGGRKRFVSIKPRRFYWLDGLDSPTNIPEYVLRNRFRTLPNRHKPSHVVERLKRFVKRLHEDIGLIQNCECVFTESNEGLLSKGKYLTRCGQEFNLNRRKGRMLKALKPSSQRFQRKFAITVTGPNVTKKLNQMVLHFNNALGSIGLADMLEICVVDPSVITRQQFDLAIVGVSGRKGDELPITTQEFLQELTNSEVPFRLFSLDNDIQTMKWATFDMLPFLLELTGIYLYQLKHSINQDLVFLGLDLGHPRKRSSRSNVVATLLDSSGRLIQHKSIRQTRDETIRPESLKVLLGWFKEYKAKHFPQAKAVVIRDGRLFQNEHLRLYQKCLGEPFTFIEVMKRQSPLILNHDGSQPVGVSYGISDCSYRVVLPSGNQMPNGFNHSFKYNVCRNDLELSTIELDTLLSELCYAPSLGLSPLRIPSPIYWSDGIAAISSRNHQFSGINLNR